MKILPFKEIVKEVDGETVVYLRRFFLFPRNKFANLYLHHIMRSDDDAWPHDHPWNFASLILKNGYLDEQWGWLREWDAWGKKFREDPTYCPEKYEITRPGKFVYRKAEHVHRVILDRGPAWTLVFTGRRFRQWGFWVEGKFTFWREFLNFWGENDLD